MIEAAENILRDLGFHDVRVRHHGLDSKFKTQNSELPSALARIEVGPVEMAKFLAGDTAARVAAALKEIGYAHVTLDLLGYRRGSTNEALPKNPPAPA